LSDVYDKGGQTAKKNATTKEKRSYPPNGMAKHSLMGALS